MDEQMNNQENAIVIKFDDKALNNKYYFELVVDQVDNICRLTNQARGFKTELYDSGVIAKNNMDFHWPLRFLEDDNYLNILGYNTEGHAYPLPDNPCALRCRIDKWYLGDITHAYVCETIITVNYVDRNPRAPVGTFFTQDYIFLLTGKQIVFQKELLQA